MLIKSPYNTLLSHIAQHSLTATDFYLMILPMPIMTQKSRTNLQMHRAKEYLLKGFVELTQRNPGESIFNEYWDSLIILDDCRFDIFENEYLARNLPGRLESKVSLGSWTGEFLIKNFEDEHYDDIVYITANPFVDKYLRGKFYRVISVWKEHWDERYNTVPPDAVYLETVKALRKYPDKRLIVHFLQPHHPYFTLRNFEDDAMAIIKTSVEKKDFSLSGFPREPPHEIYLSEIYAYFSLPRLVRAYIDNLHIVFPYVELLLHRLPGRTVVTADHGELFGQTVTRVIPIRVYGHGIGRVPELILVPWWEVNTGDKLKLRPIKEIKKDIAKIERRFGFRASNNEAIRLRRVISTLKLRGNI